jgi:hypothetical protein
VKRKSKAQASAELIVLIAAVLAVALVFVAKMQDTAKKGASAIDKNANKLFGEINDTAGIGTAAAKKAAGAACTKDSQCASGNCDAYLKKCR